MGYIGQKPAELALTSSDITDDVVSLAKMAGGTDGNIISFDASGDPVAIATGNDGQVLTSTGAGSPPAFEAAAGGGKINQVLFMTTTTEVSVGSSSYTDSGLTQAITPSASDSRVLIMGMIAGQLINGGVDKSYDAKILRDTTEIETEIIQRYMKHGSDLAETMSQFFCFVDSPSTTSAVTYKVQVKGDNGGTIKVSMNSQPSNMTVMEILA